jgi:hypothetical protein
MRDGTDQAQLEATLVRARRLVYERLALISAVTWAVGTLVLFVMLVPPTSGPGPRTMVAMLVPLIPAAIPWLFYERISVEVARRWVRKSPPPGSA